ncbi:MAG: efflux RND transporter periplasmic adaptor subunit [Agitococcus sp.]|nr:efflux RND transporter periplasmic adaptor subunit [Agitococcus sp.]
MNKWLTLLAIGISYTAQAEPLKVTTVAYREVEATYDSLATAEAERQSTVSAQMAGRIVEINFRVGERVQQGQVIMRIDPTAANQDVAGMQARVHEAEVQLDNTQKQYNRLKDLFKQQYVSQSQLDKAEADFKSAQAQVNTLKAGLGQSATQRNFATITAPYSGVMSALYVEVGEMAVAGKALATGYDPSNLRVTAQVPQTYIEAVRSNQKAYIEISGQREWLATSSMTILPSADPRTHSTEIRLRLPSNSPLAPNQLARAHFVTGIERRLVVPVSSILRRSELTAVYVIPANNKAQLRQVRIGKTLANGWIEVLAGVNVGERIALEPIAAGLGN